jgi:G patch domain-containing protein 1
MDIFKAIFASDDEDDEEDENGRPEENGGDDKDVPTASQAPAHFQVHDATTETSAMTYEPKSVDRPSANSEIVDVATFKPVFVPRSERGTQKSKDKDKTDGRGKDKKRVKPIVSFEDDDEGAALVIAPQADKARKKKKRRKEEGTTNVVVSRNDQDAEMWVEKAPPEVVTSFVDAPAVEGGVRIEGASLQPPTSSSTQVLQRSEGPPRGRKRAIDFL